MKFKRAIIVFLFLLPVFVVLCLAIYHKKHPAAQSYGSSVFTASGAQIAKTLRDWNDANSNSYIDASDHAVIETTLRRSLQAHGLTETQIKQGEQSCLDLLDSLKSGNYNEFLRSRLPSQEYRIFDNVAKGLKHYSTLPESSGALEHYQNIWERTFSTNSLWSQIMFNPTNSIVLGTNTSILKNHLDFPEFDGKKGNAYVEAYVSTAFNYDKLEQKELDSIGRVTTLSVFFMGKEPQLNQARPFMISFFWDSEVNKWIPIDFMHGFIQNPAVKFRFF